MKTKKEQAMNDGRNRKRGANGRMRSVLFGGGLLVLALYGCSSSEEATRAAELAGACSIDGDCAGGLICAFSRCHERCIAEKDCPAGQRCVRGDVPTETVCQLPDDVECKVDKDCEGLQVCGIDDECRDPCDDEGDCVAEHVCATSGECASTDPTRDSLDAEGNIVVEGNGGTAGGGGTSGGKAGASGGGGQAGSAQPSGGGSGEGGEGGDGGGVAGRGGSEASGGNGATSGDAGDAGSAGEGGSASPAGGTSGAAGTAGSSGVGGAVAGSAAGGTAGAGGAQGGSGGVSGGDGGTAGGAGTAGSGGTPGEDLSETPDGIETVPNNTREEAVALTTGATIHLAGSDHDWFVVTPPQNGKSHIVSLRIEQDPNLAADLTIEAAEDHSQIGHPHFDQGVTSFAYVTAGPNAVLHLDFARYPIANSLGSARITMEIVPENDVYEPNDDSDTPAPIGVGETVSGQILNPWVNATDEYFADWFAIDLVQGTATFTLLAAPEEARIRVRRMSATNQISSIVTTDAGEIPTEQFSVAETGTYRIGLDPYNSSVASASTGAKPTYLTEQYSFVITQP
jgi:hypothetical protein